MAKGLGKRRVLVVGLVVLGLIGAFVGSALGNHVFSDVPSGAYYHNDVTWLANTGITAGCGGGKYCPNEAVTRGQMAVFLHKMTNRTRVGHFSCAADGFQPQTSSQTFAVNAGASSNGSMSCPVHIPDAATVTKLSVAFYDNDAADVNCTLYQAHILSSIGAYEPMATVATTGTPGFTRLSDASVTTPFVDNNSYSYIVSCNFFANSSSLVVWGASIEYTYAGIPAP